jgi:putative transposase
MNFTENNIYHIYNRGNNKQLLFFEEDNYLYFLTLIKKFIKPRCEILAWCLMPNHFHFLIFANSITVQYLEKGNIPSQRINEGIRLALSSYTKGINKRYNRTGNLFQQKTKSKCVCEGKGNYVLAAFHYIHQNSWKAGLVNKIEDWQYSSFKDYANFRKGNLCNKELSVQLFDLDTTNFIEDSNAYAMIDEGKIF